MRYLAIGGAVSALALSACGGGGERQDENEPEGTFEVDVVDAKFPQRQKLAKRSELEITVRNTGEKTVPNIAVTVNGFDIDTGNSTLADPNRPVFVVNGQPREIGGFAESKDEAPEGGETAYVGTWALGPLEAGEEETFRWSVTAVKAGEYKITYKVAAGLDGKAKAVSPGGTPVGGVFVGTIDDTPPDTRVAEDGVTVVEGQRGETEREAAEREAPERD
jgi:hypothetical protein